MLNSNRNIERYEYKTFVKKYEFRFPFWSTDDIEVWITVNGRDELVDKSNYTVSAPGAAGTVTLNNDYTVAGATNLTIVRNVPILQTSDYRNGEPIDAENIEQSFDSITAMVQQVSEQIQRTVQLPISENAQTFMMPGTEARKGKVLGFDATGKNFSIYENPNEAIGSIETDNYVGVEGKPTVITFTKLNGDSFSVTLYNGKDGEKGDKLTYSDLTESDKEELRKGLSSVTKKYESVSELSSSVQDIAINIPEYDSSTDALDVYVNGMRLDSSEYEILENSSIRLASAVGPKAAVSFVATKHLTLSKDSVEDIIKDLVIENGNISTEIVNDDSRTISAGAVYRYKESNDSIINGLIADLGNKASVSILEANYAKKSELSNVYKYKGEVLLVSDLPASGNSVGDVYNVKENDGNYAWTGTEWDYFGGGSGVAADIDFASMAEVQNLITNANSIYGDSQLNSALDEINGEVV